VHLDDETGGQELPDGSQSAAEHEVRLFSGAWPS
jgi:hypothetical protein